jgi:malate dehydrogenase (oxaloacetate-decarboxylating)(NADP+)
MKMAASMAIAKLAHEPVPESVSKAMDGRTFEFGREYVVPTPFDPRLIERIACAVAQAAADSGVAKTPITDWDAYKKQLAEISMVKN